MTTHLTHTFRNVGGIRLAEDLDALSRDEIDAVAQRNLWATLTAAYESTTVWRSFPPALAAVDSLEDFSSLPLLSAADVAAGCPPPHSADLLFDQSPPGLVLRSSGTASRPKVLYHSWDFTDRVGHLGGYAACVRPCRAGRSRSPTACGPEI